MAPVQTTEDSQFDVGLVVDGRSPTLTVSLVAASMWLECLVYVEFGETRSDCGVLDDACNRETPWIQ